MTENSGLLKTLEVLGDKVVGLENDLRFERLCRNQLSEDVERLKAENSSLETQLSKVQTYIEERAEV